jgi:hypothetical protein
VTEVSGPPELERVDKQGYTFGGVMDRQDFIDHLMDGKPATVAVKRITGYKPQIVTIASHDGKDVYVRYGVMMSGPIMAAIVVLTLYPDLIDEELMGRIKMGEPCGSVLKGLKRRGRVVQYGIAVQGMASLIYEGKCVGSAVEVFTESLFNVHQSPCRRAVGVVGRLQILYSFFRTDRRER